MFNQFKLLLVVIILGTFGILFFQNQEPISLQLLCSDTASQYCWYQTPTLPLAIWMSLFLILGVTASLFWQLLQSFSSPVPRSDNQSDAPTSSRSKNYSTREVFTSTSQQTSKTTKPKSTSSADWEYSGAREDWESEQSSSSKTNSTINQDDTLRSSSFEVEQKPQNISQSGSTYSYQFKKSSKPKDPAKNKNNDDTVYDANYRTINSPTNPNQVDQDLDLDDDEEDWI